MTRSVGQVTVVPIHADFVRSPSAPMVTQASPEWAWFGCQG
jgi:hypothetical protein